MAKQSTYYLVTYRDPQDSKIVSLKVKKIEDSSLGLTFIALSDFVFETSSVLVDPEAEALASRFKNVQTLHLSIHSVISIAELGEHDQKLEFKNDKSNLLVLNPESGENS